TISSTGGAAGTGEIKFGTSVPGMWLNQTGMTLTVGQGVLIHGGLGSINNSGGVSNTTITNNGTIRADAAGTLTVAPNTLTNTALGHLEVTVGGAILNIAPTTFTNQNALTLSAGTFSIN